MAKREGMLILCSLLLLIVSSEQASFDYFQVVLQWQPTTCIKSRCSITPNNKFSIHGVWPSKTSGSTVGPCTGSAFDKTKIASIKTGLQQNWPDVISGNDAIFWDKEWEKHGTCSEKNFFNQFEYFEFGLDVYLKHDILGILKSKNIKADGSRYQKTDVEKAIKGVTKKLPGLRCYEFQDNKYQLHEINLCYNKNEVLEDCPTSVSPCPRVFTWVSRKVFDFEVVE